MTTFLSGTILARKTPIGDSLDKIKVVGPSPIRADNGTGDSFVVHAHDGIAPNVLSESVLVHEYDVAELPFVEEVENKPGERAKPFRLSPLDALRQQRAKSEQIPATVVHEPVVTVVGDHGDEEDFKPLYPGGAPDPDAIAGIAKLDDIAPPALTAEELKAQNPDALAAADAEFKAAAKKGK